MTARLRIALFLGGALVAISWPARPAAEAAEVSQAAISADELLSRLALARDEAVAAGAHPSPDGMRLVRAALGLPLAVTLPQGTVLIPVDPLLESLSGDTPEDFLRAADRLGALERRARVAAGFEPLPADRVEAALTSAYRGIAPSSTTLPERIMDRIAAFLGRMVDALTTFSGPITIVAWTVVAALVAAAFLLFRRRIAVVPDRSVASRVGGGDRGYDWRALAEQAFGRGDLREGVRHLYRATVDALVARAIVPDVPGLTAGECRRAVGRSRPDLSPVVSQATVVFERVAFGRRAPGPDDVERMREAVRAASGA